MASSNGTDAPPKAGFLLTVWRSVRLRCPRCGEGRLFRNLWSMAPACDSCQLEYQREGGFFLGSIYVNYGLTSLLATIAYPVSVFALGLPRTPTIVAIVAFIILFPLWFFRYARSLWLGFDQYVDPR